MPKSLLSNPLRDSNIDFDIVLPPLYDASWVTVLSNIFIRSPTFSYQRMVVTY